MFRICGMMDMRKKESIMENVYELLYMIRTGDTRAFEMLKEECFPTVRTLAYEMTPKVEAYGIALDDLMQEGLICMDLSVRCYRPDRNAGFRTFLSLMVDRRFKRILRSCHAIKRTDEDMTLSLDQYVTAKGVRLDKFYAQKDRLSEPEYYLAYQEALEVLRQTIEELNEKDREALYDWFQICGTGSRLTYGMGKDNTSCKKSYTVKRRVVNRFMKVMGEQ